MNNVIGLNIKKRREQLSFTLRRLSQEIGLSASFLSQVETGKVLPSMLSLKKIADALHTTIGVLVGESGDITEDPVVRVDKRKELTDAENRMIVNFLSSPHPDKLMEPMIMVLDVNEDAKGSNIRYQHFGQEFVLVLKGRIEVAVSDKRYLLNEGDSIYFNSGDPHAFWNIHSGKSEVLSINTPPNF